MYQVGKAERAKGFPVENQETFGGFGQKQTCSEGNAQLPKEERLEDEKDKDPCLMSIDKQIWQSTVDNIFLQNCFELRFPFQDKQVNKILVV